MMSAAVASAIDGWRGRSVKLSRVVFPAASVACCVADSKSGSSMATEYGPGDRSDHPGEDVLATPVGVHVHGDVAVLAVRAHRDASQTVTRGRNNLTAQQRTIGGRGAARESWA